MLLPSCCLAPTVSGWRARVYQQCDSALSVTRGLHVAVLNDRQPGADLGFLLSFPDWKSFSFQETAWRRGTSFVRVAAEVSRASAYEVSCVWVAAVNLWATLHRATPLRLIRASAVIKGRVGSLRSRVTARGAPR